jgi:hypothetical protein
MELCVPTRDVAQLTMEHSVAVVCTEPKGASHAVLCYYSWGYTARLGGPPREALYTVALRGEC